MFRLIDDFGSDSEMDAKWCTICHLQKSHFLAHNFTYLGSKIWLTFWGSYTWADILGVHILGLIPRWMPTRSLVVRYLPSSAFTLWSSQLWAKNFGLTFLGSHFWAHIFGTHILGLIPQWMPRGSLVVRYLPSSDFTPSWCGFLRTSLNITLFCQIWNWKPSCPQ